LGVVRDAVVRRALVAEDPDRQSIRPDGRRLDGWPEPHRDLALDDQRELQVRNELGGPRSGRKDEMLATRNLPVGRLDLEAAAGGRAPVDDAPVESELPAGLLHDPE